jgi:hypothetical protein
VVLAIVSSHDTDKIELIIDYWSFPSAAGAVVSFSFPPNPIEADDQKQDALDKAQIELESINTKLAESALALKEAQKGREDTVSWFPFADTVADP